MEVLTLLIRRRVADSDVFDYHIHCERQQIVNICFADDLFLFCRGTADSVQVLSNALNEFTEVSGLAPSLPKSTAFLCNVPVSARNSILHIMPFLEGKLPVRYLGVPLISTRLLTRDCKPLVEKVRNRIGNWKNKWLSLAGRLQLVASVLSSLQGYWAALFILPVSIIKEIEALIRGFLWCQGDMKRGKAKVSWKVVCLPKSEGGLGIKRLEVWNKTLMAKHIWNLLTRKDSMWVRWIYHYKLRDRSFWDVPAKGDLSWSWRKILHLRDLIRKHFWFRVGNGTSISVWFDIWNSVCPLSQFISRHAINRDFQISDTIADVALVDSWNWPSSWISRFPLLLQLPNPVLTNNPDKLLWRTLSGDIVEFKISLVWDDLRPRADLVDWVSIVWYPMCIPRHSIHLWLVLGGKLKTQDRLRQWDVGPATDLNLLRCSLCNYQQDSHSHLFFECSFSSQVWMEVVQFAGYGLQSISLVDCVAWFQPIASRKSVRSIIFKLILGATSYFIWQERNLRLFKKQRRSKDQLVAAILETVRLRLYSFRFKPSDRVSWAMEKWKIPSFLIREG